MFCDASETVALASSCPLLQPVAAPGRHAMASSEVKRSQFLKVNDNVAVAPYQALPVTGPVITKESKSSGFPVLEPDASMSAEEREAHIVEIIDRYTKKLQERTAHHMGYPYNLDFDYGALEGLVKYSINNLGDPFIESNYGVHSREFEVGVLNWFARLWEIDEEEYYGYITTCGTEGNLHGIYVGRENLPDGILYASAESHYSVFKAARMYRMPAVKVGTLATGEIDYDDLRQRLLENKDKPAILNVNIGTTVKGAVDDLDKASAVLSLGSLQLSLGSPGSVQAKVLDILKACGFSEDRFFIHCDGALFGMMMPFLRADAPMVSFRKPIGSISVSGHKFVGAPVPCGVVITRFRYVMALSTDVEYLNSRDATIMGSRNGHAPIYLWYTLTRKGYEGMRADVERCMRNAHVLKDMLLCAGIKTMLNELSNTVVFERPREEPFVRKWQLACEGDIAHVVVMPNIDIAKLEEFVQASGRWRLEGAGMTRDLVQSRARMAIAAAKRVAGTARALEEEAAAQQLEHSA
ncbi:hypothetical protein QJQ45_020416 [Haematococcus lacustris]|nr:hypothetical protein QJQ45_020416 [Haematococcus lacustris]